MRIGFEATPIAAKKSGIGYYSENLLHELAPLGGEEIRLLSNVAPVFDDGAPTNTRWTAEGAFRFRAPWMQFLLPHLLGRLDLDLVHYVNFNAPLLSRHPFVVTFHDMVLQLYPEFYTWKKRILTRNLMPRVAERARAIIVVSHTVKRELAQIMGIDPSRIFVVHNAAGASFRPINDDEAEERVRNRHHIEGPYVLSVGTLEPRKNLGRLIPAFVRARKEAGFPHRLVVVGARGWKFDPIVEALDSPESRDCVQFLDYVDLADLPVLYGAADLFVFPSIYEGFGIPLVEAMATGTPVLASDIDVHREILGRAGDFCDPLDVEDISRGLVRRLSGSESNAELAEAGLERSRLFSWKRAAAETWQVYESALSGAPAPIQDQTWEETAERLARVSDGGEEDQGRPRDAGGKEGQRLPQDGLPEDGGGKNGQQLPRDGAGNNSGPQTNHPASHDAGDKGGPPTSRGIAGAGLALVETRTRGSRPDRERTPALRDAILRTLIYARSFHYPLTPAEVQARLLGEVASLFEVQTGLEDLRDEGVRIRNGFVEMDGDDRLVERRRQNEALHDELIAGHRFALRVLSRIPGVRLVAFSGGTSHRNSGRAPDVDLFVVTARGRLFTVYAAIVFWSRLLGKRQTLCANYLVEEDALEIQERDLFTATELVHLRALEPSPLLPKLWAANLWVRRFLPNARSHPVEQLWSRSRIERLLSSVLDGLGRLVAFMTEPSATAFFRWKLKRQFGESADGLFLGPERLRLHPSDQRPSVLLRYQDLLQSYDSSVPPLLK